MNKQTPKAEYRNYLSMAKLGFYPLFFEQWMSESLNENHILNSRKANHNVKHVFNMLSKHKTIEKKKTALISMDKFSREEFIRSFFKVVEEDILKENKTLQ